MDGDQLQGEQAAHDGWPGGVRFGLHRPVVETGDQDERQDGERPGSDTQGQAHQEYGADGANDGHQEADGHHADAEDVEGAAEKIEDAGGVVGVEVAIGEVAAIDARGQVEEVALVDEVDPEAGGPRVSSEDGEADRQQGQPFAGQQAARRGHVEGNVTSCWEAPPPTSSRGEGGFLLECRGSAPEPPGPGRSGLRTSPSESRVS